MFNRIKTAALAAVVGFGAIAAAPVAAQADSFYFGIGPAGPSFGYADRDHRGPRDRWDRPGRWDRDACSQRDALRKADRMGVNRAFVRGENRNIIRVAGFSRGDRVNLTFAKAPGCPIIR